VTVATDPNWWRSSVTYQIYIRSFADDNGDGVGDVNGIRAHVDYIAALGVDALWINPWYPSPQGPRRLRRCRLPRHRADLRVDRRGSGADQRGARRRLAGAARHRPQSHLRRASLVSCGARRRAVEAEEADRASMLWLYRDTLQLRRKLPELHGDGYTWMESGDDVLAFSRGEQFACVVNFGSDAIDLPSGEVLLTSAPLDDGRLPTDAAAWVRLS
jgi:glycosidase